MKRLVALLAIMLLSFGLSNAANVVTVDVVGDTVWAGIANYFGFSFENSTQWNGASLGFAITSPDGATITYLNQGSAGYPAPTVPNPTPKRALTVVAGSRWDPPTSVWDFGFVVTEHEMDQTLPDSIIFGGTANNGGLVVGPNQEMLRVHFSAGPTGETVHMLCIDSTKVGPAGEFVYADPTGASFTPAFVSQKCWPVKSQADLPPVFTNCPSSAIAVSHCANGTIDLNATDAADIVPDPFSFSVVGHDGTGTASINAATGELTYSPGLPGDVNNTVTVTVRVADAFGGTNCDVQFTFGNQVPTIDCGSGVSSVGKGNPFTRQITGNDADLCDTKTFAVVSIVPPAVGVAGINASTGLFSWATNDPGDIGSHVVTISVTDGYSQPVTCTFNVEVLIVEPFGIQIEKVHDVLQGHFYDINIVVKGASEMVGGFDFLISYDASALSFTEAFPGAFLTSHKWEYFTYRFGANGNCGSACPSGLVRVVGLAETNNGPFHPIHASLAAGDVLATLRFLVSNNRTFECMYVPIRFFWYDCGDNVMSSIGGDTLYISRNVYDYWGTGGVDSFIAITNNAYGFPGWFGAPDVPCMNGDKGTPVRFIDFYNGGFDIVCADSIDDRGDINMNGVKNEIADAVMFTNYFITGLTAFGTHVEASIAASDVNADGIALSVADLVYLIRVVVGDALPYDKPLPASAMTVNAQGNVVSYMATENVGAVLLTFEGTAVPTLNVAGMDMLFGQNGNELRVLVYNIGKNAIPAGTGTLLTLSGDANLTNVEAASYFGGAMNVTIRNLPQTFTLAQNSPNPFNPSTKIAMNMPVESDYSVAIYNVAGQLVREFSGHASAGTVELIWDGTDNSNTQVASGIYFYKATASNFSATKKMVLMK